MSKSVGFSRCPQAPSAFIKLIVQGAIFGSHYLDCLIILHAQNLSDQTSAVNKNDRLFIYTSPVYPHGRLPACRLARRAQALRRPGSAIIEQAPVRRGRLVLDPQHDAPPLQAVQRCLNHIADLEHAGDITVQVLAALLHRRVRQRRAIQRQEDQQPKLTAGILHQREPAGGRRLPGIACLLQGVEAVRHGYDIEA